MGGDTYSLCSSSTGRHFLIPTFRLLRKPEWRGGCWRSKPFSARVLQALGKCEFQDHVLQLETVRNPKFVRVRDKSHRRPERRVEAGRQPPAILRFSVRRDDEGHVDEPCPSRDAGEVRHPEPVRRWDTELAVAVIERAWRRPVADGSADRLAADHAGQPIARTCISQNLEAGTTDSQLITNTSLGGGIIVARNALSYPDGLLQWQVCSTFGFEVREGRFRIAQSNLERFSERGAGWDGIGRYTGNGWKKAEAVFAASAMKVAGCVPNGPSKAAWSRRRSAQPLTTNLRQPLTTNLRLTAPPRRAEASLS